MSSLSEEKEKQSDTPATSTKDKKTIEDKLQLLELYFDTRVIDLEAEILFLKEEVASLKEKLSSQDNNMKKLLDWYDEHSDW